MQEPLRYQFTEYDCAPITLLNAFSYLYKREEIPAIIVKAVCRFTLDCDKDGKLGSGGTSKKAMQRFTKWFINYAKLNDYHIYLKRLVGKDVNINSLKDVLKQNGVTIARCWQSEEHYVLITKMTKKYVYLFDPYYIKKKVRDKALKIINNKPMQYNRKVSLKRLFAETKEDFALGKIDARECIIMKSK